MRAGLVQFGPAVRDVDAVGATLAGGADRVNRRVAHCVGARSAQPDTNANANQDEAGKATGQPGDHANRQPAVGPHRP